jgi:ubiquinone/menaquinone biosynthesis C-methylase UbiE
MRQPRVTTTAWIASASLLLGVGIALAPRTAAQAAAQGNTPAAVDADRSATAAELKQAEQEAPRLVEVLELKPGTTVADVGAGRGAMSIVMSRWLGPSGRIYATDITETALAALRAAKTREGLENLAVIEGGERATNLPDTCCDGIFVRNVYHHITQPADFTRSLAASLRPGGRLAILDFEPDEGSALPEGVPKNRGGHGVPRGVVEEELRAAGFVHVRTIAPWLPNAKESFLVLVRRPS